MTDVDKMCAACPKMSSILTLLINRIVQITAHYVEELQWKIALQIGDSLQ